MQLEQTRGKLGAIVGGPNAAIAAVPLIGANLIGAPSLGLFVTGTVITGGVNAGAQYAFTGKVDYTDLIGQSLAGGLTFGRNFIPSLYINMETALITSTIKRENPGVKLVGTIAGTGAGSVVSNTVGKTIISNGNGAALAAAINGNIPMANAIAASRQPVNAVLSSGIQEAVGNKTESLLNKK